MQLYSHILNIRIRHPTLDPDLVSCTLGLEPRISWRAGDPRRTPKGTALDGVRSEGYWSCDPFSYGWRDSTDAQIEDALEEVVALLEPHTDFLRSISLGGEVRIWISSQSARSYALELPPSMLLRVGSLGASVVHDVYQGA